MSAKRMRVIAAATLFLAAGVSLWLVRPSRAWAAVAAGSQTAAQNPTPNPTPAPTNPSPQTAPAIPARNPDQTAPGSYKPAAVVSAADVQYPLQTTAEGIVVFNVSLDAGGAFRKITALQDVPPLTAAAQQSLKAWKFVSASQNGTPEDSEMLVAFVFRHAVYVANPPRFTPIFPAKTSAEASRGFVPPGILSVVYAGYPASTIASGAVVVQSNVKPDGSVGGVSVVRDLQGGFGALAINAAKRWRFQAALREGQPIPGKVAIAFVFSSRSLNPF